MYKAYVKRGLDIVFSLLALIVLAPLLLVIALWIRLDSPGPAFFRQKRVGAGGRLFSIIKFRTMWRDTPADVATDQLTDAASHITRCGRFLRRTSLDELPQLINILVGDMSIVGPRPALWNQEELNRMRSEQGIMALRPGLTGWAQVNGRDMLNDVEKVRYDAEYAQRLSFGMDALCVWRTLGAVVRQSGVAEGKPAERMKIGE